MYGLGKWPLIRVYGNVHSNIFKQVYSYLFFLFDLHLGGTKTQYFHAIW